MIEEAEEGDRIITLGARFHCAIRSLYMAANYADSYGEFDDRDLSVFEGTEVPDVRPLFGGEIYDGLCCIYEEGELLESIVTWMAKREKARRRTLDKRQGKDPINELGAFLACKRSTFTSIYPSLSMILADFWRLAPYDVDCSGKLLLWAAGRQKQTVRYLQARIQKNKRNLEPSEAAVMNAMRSYVPEMDVPDLRLFVKSLSCFRATTIEFKFRIDNFVRLSSGNTASISSALRQLVMLSYVLFLMEFNIERAVPAWEYFRYNML